MLAQFRDWIKTQFKAEYYQIGKIDNSREKVIGIYGDSPLTQIESFGKNSSYGSASIRILLHWTKNAADTETAARGLFESLRHVTDVDMSDVHVQYLYLSQDEPAFIGTDENGVYEYVITATIYYRR